MLDKKRRDEFLEDKLGINPEQIKGFDCFATKEIAIARIVMGYECVYLCQKKESEIRLTVGPYSPMVSDKIHNFPKDDYCVSKEKDLEAMRVNLFHEINRIWRPEDITIAIKNNELEAKAREKYGSKRVVLLTLNYPDGRIKVWWDKNIIRIGKRKSVKTSMSTLHKLIGEVIL